MNSTINNSLTCCAKIYFKLIFRQNLRGSASFTLVSEDTKQMGTPRINKRKPDRLHSNKEEKRKDDIMYKIL